MDRNMETKNSSFIVTCNVSHRDKYQEKREPIEVHYIRFKEQCKQFGVY